MEKTKGKRKFGVGGCQLYHVLKENGKCCILSENGKCYILSENCKERKKKKKPFILSCMPVLLCSTCTLCLPVSLDTFKTYA